jgi:histidinol phosphatase-like enzyme
MLRLALRTTPHSFDQLVCFAPFAHLLVSYTSCYSCNININSCIGTNLETVTHNSNAGIDELMTQVNEFKKEIKADANEFKKKTKADTKE